MADDAGSVPGESHRFAPDELLAGRFRIVRALAAGGMGVVYEAQDERLHRRIALKAARAGRSRWLAPEVRNASTVSHPNVCRIFELHTAHRPEGDVDFITMEFIEGETLARRLERGALPEQEARAVALQLCAGLAEAHRSGVVHGDLKPANIVLGHDAEGRPRAVIMDFGLARGARADGAVGGTPGYMAPELASGAPTSVASDLYALGIILHELVSGEHPRTRAAAMASTVTVSSAAAASGPADTPQPLGSRWDPILARCLAPEPAKRFTSVAELARALDPPRGRGRAIALVLAALVTIAAVAYWRVSAPTTTVRLAVESPLPLQEALTALRGTRSVGFQLTRDARKASHQLRIRVSEADSARVVAAELRATGASTPLAHWEARYPSAEWSYAPTAVAAMVSATLHLQPDARLGTLRDANAKQAYDAALPLLRSDPQLDSALAGFERAAQSEPASPLPWAALAEAQWRKYYLTDGAEWVARCRASVASAERRGQDTPEVHRIAGLLEANEGRFAQAIQRYVRATELPSRNADAWRRLGEAYRLDNQPAPALAALQRATQVEPGYARTHQDLGSWYFARGDYAASVPELAEAVRLAPASPRPRSVLASAYTNLGRFADAERTLRDGLSQAEDAALMLPLAQTLMYQSRPAEAIPLLARAEALDSTQMLTPLYLGNCLELTGRRGEAQAAYRRALEIAQQVVMRSPQLGYYRGFLAYLWARLGDRTRATVEIEQARRLAPDAADVRWAAALTYETLGMRDAALEVLQPAPYDQLADLARWPEASALTNDERFRQLMQSQRRTP